MCRLALYLGEEITVGSLVTEPVNSIIHQSYHSHERREPLNGDGFGVAWYAPEVSPEPALFRDITPAWNNANLKQVARVTRSRCVLAHVRAASPGLPVTRLNCHPFVRGPFAFMHNGRIGGFRRIRRTILDRLSPASFDAVEGSTDSEYLFALFCDRIRDLTGGHRGARAMADALAATIADVESIGREAGVEEVSRLNLAVSDGTSAAVSRYIGRDLERANSLYVHSGRRYTCDGGVCRMIDPEATRGAVIIASEPLSDDPGWERIPPNHLVCIEPDLAVSITPI